PRPPARRRHAAARTSLSHVEADLEDIAVYHFVVLTLDAQLACILGRLPGAQAKQFVPSDHLGPDETTLEVRMDDAGTLGRPGTGPERPGPALFFTGRQEGPAAQQVIGGPGHPGQGAFAQAEALQEFGPGPGVKLGRLGFQLDADSEHVAVCA